jgi:hypothetical protein
MIMIIDHDHEDYETKLNQKTACLGGNFTVMPEEVKNYNPYTVTLTFGLPIDKCFQDNSVRIIFVTATDDSIFPKTGEGNNV